MVAYLAHGEAKEGEVEKPKYKRGSEVPSPQYAPTGLISLSL